MSENKKLFREKSLEQFSTPEQLNDYIRVTNPSVFLFLIGIIAFLIGVVIWGMTGTIEASSTVDAVSSGGYLTAYVPFAEASDIGDDSLIRVNGSEYKIVAVSNPVRAADILSSDRLSTYSLSPNDMVVGVSANTPLADGVYTVQVVMVKMRPSDLILK